jgi:uncharacterized protein YidB (DUF937 family)
MARGYPSMTALLGLLAIAGYQNRDKIAEMLGGLGQGQARAPGQGNTSSEVNRQGAQNRLPGGLDNLLGGLGGAGVGGLLGGGLRDLVESFKQAGQGEAAESWVGRGPNKQISPQHLEQAIGPDVLATLSRETGLSHDELLSRLTRNLPEAVDKYTPDGRIPGEHELARS